MKNIKYHNKTEKEALEYTSKLVDFGVTLVVYAALNELLNAYYLLQRSKYFRTTVKRLANEAVRMRNMKVVELKSVVMHKGFSESYWDAIVDVCEDDISAFRTELVKVLEEASVDDGEIYAQAEVARVLLGSAKAHFEKVIKDCTNLYRTQDAREMRNLNLFDTFHEFYVDGIYKQWNLVCDELYKDKDRNIELTNDKTIESYNVLADKFVKGGYIDECLRVATREHPEYTGVKIRITK